MEITVGGTADIGAGIAMLFTGPIMHKFGRNRVISSSALLFIVGWILVIVAPGTTLLFIGRIVVGLGMGVATPPTQVNYTPSFLSGSGVL